MGDIVVSTAWNEIVFQKIFMKKMLQRKNTYQWLWNTSVNRSKSDFNSVWFSQITIFHFQNDGLDKQFVVVNSMLKDVTVGTDCVVLHSYIKVAVSFSNLIFSLHFLMEYSFPNIFMHFFLSLFTCIRQSHTWISKFS